MSNSPRCKWPGCRLAHSRRRLCRSHYYSMRDLSKLSAEEVRLLQERKPFLNVVHAYATLTQTPDLLALVTQLLPAQAEGLRALMREERRA